MKTLVSWSGGKDSCYAMMQAIAAGYQPTVLLNMMNENGQISRSHGLPHHLLLQQAEAVGLPLITVPASWEAYEMRFIAALHQITELYKVGAAVFGDIDLQAHRDWEEKVCAAAGIEAVLPLWQQPRRALVEAMLRDGIRTMIVSCNVQLGPDFLGRVMDMGLVHELEAKGVDVCGENGEFHTLVVDCPLFKGAVHVGGYEKVRHGDYWFLQWEDKA
ncbi:diphthine--ammonia ligase [Chitinophaga agrisoli]|uniref:Diphthine--ammonia ligase n=1 Tax=Chitinophaga agrisoli TaxID=2607653 RepID=A0A5B2VHY5_9BACT|nr:diphthine--ammonia ligase [Chitinophaga agrisoli]KAA2238544.1 diphthine--ammonia ligase [Chitinophaga agrisoli]